MEILVAVLYCLFCLGLLVFGLIAGLVLGARYVLLVAVKDTRCKGDVEAFGKRYRVTEVNYDNAQGAR